MQHNCFTCVLPGQEKCFTRNAKDMVLPTLKFVYNRKGIATTTKEASVELRISFERKSKYISTGVRLLPKHWRGTYVTNRADAAELNETLDLIMAKVRKIVNTMAEEGRLDIGEIASRLANATAEKQSFLDFCEQRTQIRIYGKKGDTAERYMRFMRWLREWNVIVWFNDVTEKNILRMDRELADTGMKNYSKWNNYHRFMNSFILDAIDEGYLQRNPYKWIHIKKDKTSGLHKYLTREEFACIENAKMPTESLERVRDLFVFQTYTCLAYADMANFDRKRVVDGVYTGRRGKTGQEFSFALIGGAKRVYDKYNGLLPIISNVKYNEYLKLVALVAKIDKPITSHWARHTGATMLLNDGNVDMEIIAKILGHSSTRQTREVYAKMLDTTVASTMREYEKRINEEK